MSENQNLSSQFFEKAKAIFSDWAESMEDISQDIAGKVLAPIRIMKGMENKNTGMQRGAMDAPSKLQEGVLTLIQFVKLAEESEYPLEKDYFLKGIVAALKGQPVIRGQEDNREVNTTMVANLLKQEAEDFHGKIQAYKALKSTDKQSGSPPKEDTWKPAF